MMELDGNTFVLTNCKYFHAKLTLDHEAHVKTSEQDVQPKHFWLVEEEKHVPGCYYIKSVHKQAKRLILSTPDKKFRTNNTSRYYDDHMWKFVKNDDDQYQIYNYKHQNYRITKNGQADDKIKCYGGEDTSDPGQWWTLTPRYEMKPRKEVLWQIDNRSSRTDVNYAMEITKGIKLTNSSELSTTVGLEASLEYACMSAKLSTEIKSVLSDSKEESWSKKITVNLTAPAGKNYRVVQLAYDFHSSLPEDNLTLESEWRVDEIDGEFEDDV